MTRTALLLRSTAVLAVGIWPAVVSAAGLESPQGEVVLTVSGAITHTNRGETAVFDRAMLEALGAETFATSTIWTEGAQRFTGVPLGRLMAAVGATGSTAAATAINDYAVDIPESDWAEDAAMVAYQNRGQEMSVRDKGPLWVVYNYDADPAFRTEVIYSRSIWQLDRIVVRE